MTCKESGRVLPDRYPSESNDRPHDTKQLPVMVKRRSEVGEYIRDYKG